MTIKAILFDFDGVIVDSVNVKTEAFRELFSREKDHLSEIIDFHLANGGMSRFVKFELIYRDILRRVLSDEESKELGERFSQLVMQQVINCPYIPGALEFIKKHFQDIPLFIASGTPQNELQEIMLQRGLRLYFKEIHGSPCSKAEIIRDILARYHFKLNEMPFIGDAINDYKASVETQIPFYGYKENDLFPKHVEIIYSFQELEHRLFKE
jgi:phosphoglycolate phosphatase